MGSMDYTQPQPSDKGYYQRAYTTFTAPHTMSGVWSNVSRVGGARALFSHDDVFEMEKLTMDLVTQVALNKRLVTTAKALIIRDIIPDLDFRDQNGNVVARREWRQPWSGNYSASGLVQVYQTNDNVTNTRKVYGFYGAKLTDSGPARTGVNTNSVQLVFQDSMGNPRDYIGLTGIDSSQESMVLFRQPLIYPNEENLKIFMWPKDGTSGVTFDSIALCGVVCEPAGDTLLGT